MHLCIRDKICECWVKLVSGVMTLNASLALCIIPGTDWQTVQDVPLLPHDSNWIRWGKNNGQIQDFTIFDGHCSLMLYIPLYVSCCEIFLFLS